MPALLFTKVAAAKQEGIVIRLRARPLNPPLSHPTARPLWLQWLQVTRPPAQGNAHKGGSVAQIRRVGDVVRKNMYVVQVVRRQGRQRRL
jgi:hypothetical protein